MNASIQAPLCIREESATEHLLRARGISGLSQNSYGSGYVKVARQVFLTYTGRDLLGCALLSWLIAAPVAEE